MHMCNDIRALQVSIFEVRIQFCRLLKGLRWDENVVKEAHRHWNRKGRACSSPQWFYIICRVMRKNQTWEPFTLNRNSQCVVKSLSPLLVYWLYYMCLKTIVTVNSLLAAVFDLADEDLIEKRVKNNIPEMNWQRDKKEVGDRSVGGIQVMPAKNSVSAWAGTSIIAKYLRTNGGLTGPLSLCRVVNVVYDWLGKHIKYGTWFNAKHSMAKGPPCSQLWTDLWCGRLHLLGIYRSRPV